MKEIQETTIKQGYDEREWWRKYVTETSCARSLHGSVTTYYDKWGAVIAWSDSFCKRLCVYDDEEEYLAAIRFAPEP